MINRWIVLGSLVLSTQLATRGVSDSPWPRPVGRMTNDPDSDLIEMLIRHGRFEDAEALCHQKSRDGAPINDGAAKWAIRRSQVVSAQQSLSDDFDQAAIERAEGPVEELLRSYPNHRRRLFLEAQRVAVHRDAAHVAVQRAAVSPRDQPRHSAAADLLRATTMTQELAQRVLQEKTKLESQRGSFPIMEDLVRLEQQLQVDAVSMTVLQTELFAADSVDAIAAATQAEQAADRAITKLPADSAARSEIQRLKVEAILRAGQPLRAAAELSQLERAIGSSPPQSLTALRIRTDLANGRRTDAQRRLAHYFGSDPESAPASIEMDLARLQFMLHGASQAGEVGQWLEAIERRNGGWAKRRAEAISLSRLRSTSGNSLVDPALIAAQGQDWLRRGNPSRAAELLTAAAEAAGDPDRAIRFAVEAAAAWIAADRSIDAANVLAEVSLSNSSGQGAAEAHLQSAILLTSNDDLPHAPQPVESVLRTHLQRWPSDPTASAARAWLIKILQSQQRHTDAATVGTAISPGSISDEDLNRMGKLWRTAVRSAATDQRPETSARIEQAFRPLLANPATHRSFRSAAALFLDRSQLSHVPGSTDPPVPFIDALIELRQRGAVADDLLDPPSDLLEDVRWRLMQDGRDHPPLRKPIWEVLRRWSSETEPPLNSAERWLWQGKPEEAIESVKRSIAKHPGDAALLGQAAELLGRSDASTARIAAIDFWDQLASGSAKGSDTWHRAKLAAIALLSNTGKGDEAKRRAKYILLTTGMNAKQKRQYESVHR